MPRLLPVDWIKVVAINCLLQLYERNADFMQEWENVKEPFIPIIEQFGKVSTLVEVENLLMKSPPDDLIGWVSDLQKLRNYLRSLPNNTEYTQNSPEPRNSYDSLQKRLTPYVSVLNSLAYDWNLHARWAGEELMWRDVGRVQQETINAAGITMLDKFSDRQI